MEENEIQTAHTPEKKPKKTASIVSTVLLVLIVAVLLFNVFIAVKSMLNPKSIPDFFGWKYLVVLTGSMAGDGEDNFDAGSLVLIKECEPEEYKLGDIITFQTDSAITTTHRIIEITENGYITKGDQNNVQDTETVTPDKVEGKVIFAVPKAGFVVSFLRSPIGMGVLIVICAVVLFAPMLFKKNGQNEEKTEDKS